MTSNFFNKCFPALMFVFVFVGSCALLTIRNQLCSDSHGQVLRFHFFCIVIQYLSCCFCDSKRSNGDVLFCIGDFSFPSLYSQMLHAKTAVHASLLNKSQKHRNFFPVVVTIFPTRSTFLMIAFDLFKAMFSFIFF